MNNIERICHLNIIWSGSEEERQKISILKNYFETLEKMSKNRGFDQSDAISWVKINNGLYLTSLMSGKDLFLGILDPEKWNIHNYVDFRNIQYIGRLPNKLEKNNIAISKQITRPPMGLHKLWGSQIPKILREESIIRRMPKGLSVTPTTTPFIINVRKDPQFNNHDFVFQIDGTSGVCKTFINGTQCPINEVKTNYGNVHTLFNAVLNVCNGADLSKTSAKTIIEGDLTIDDR